MSPTPVHSVVLHRVRLRLRTPLRSAHGIESERELVLVEVRGPDDVSGWGECSALSRPTYTGEYADGAWAVLRDHLAPEFLSTSADPSADRDGVVGHPMASAAVETASTDLLLRRGGRSLVDRIGTRLGAPADSLPRTAVIGRGPVEEVLERVGRHVDAGAAVIKLKVTPRPDDLATVAAVRDDFPALALAVDANGSLDPRSFGILDELGLLYVEQPAPARDLVASAQFARRSTPVALDESIGSVGDVETAAALGSGQIINVKPARVGGLESAIAVVQRARDLGFDVFVGGMLESGVGRAAALALAACVGGLPTDVGPSADYLDVDVTEPVEAADDGRVIVPTGPGIGVTPDPDQLAAVTVDRVVVE